jgi:hypothetical protein
MKRTEWGWVPTRLLVVVVASVRRSGRYPNITGGGRGAGHRLPGSMPASSQHRGDDLDEMVEREGLAQERDPRQIGGWGQDTYSV